MSSLLPEFVVQTLTFMASIFIFAVGAGLLLVVVLYILDVSQTSQAIRRNYPVIGRFRYFFEHLGGFFRQYFFAMDREEMPFNRAQRSYVYRAAKNIDTTVAFGSTRDLHPIGTVMFVNCPFPTLETDAVETSAVTIGPGCQNPYTTNSLFNISGMSYGAISPPAIRALSNGAAKAGAWMNTGEGGLSPHHLEGGCDIVFQIGTAKYGVRNEAGELSDDKLREVAAHKSVRMFEIKMSQGAKPGKVLVPTVNLPFVPTQNCSLFGLSMTAHRVAMLALPTERERCADVRMGDQDVVEALLGAGRLEGGAVAAVRGEPSNDPLLDRDGPTGPGSVGRCERVCAASASGAQAGPLQGDHRRAT